jgi:methionyl-tRNA synthetase
MGKFYITTTLPYVNAAPHIDFALELVQADTIARVRRAAGDGVFFNFGTDEHGQKIFEAAQKSGEDVKAYVGRFAEEVKNLKEILGLSNDAFIRTTEPHHVAAAQEMWRKCDAAGDIYKKEYEGLYCVGHEAFITEKDLVDGKCPEHGTVPERLKEENYFFRLSKYQGKLLEYLGQEGVIVPEWRRQEAINFVKSGLEDFSISREKKRLSWGVPVPGDDSQVMYVWFDALTNYISTLGWPEDAEGKFKAFWEDGETLQLAGKDQVRFQSIMWQAMLMSAGIQTTDKVFYHGFITSGGQKMSKTLGNVISPYDLVKKYGTEATRYLLLRHVHPFEDSDVTWEKLDEWYEANLANGLGNLVARIFTMAEKYETQGFSTATPIRKIWTNLEAFSFNHALDQTWERISDLDQFIATEQPFVVFKSDPEKARSQVLNAITQLGDIAATLAPFMPQTSETILAAVRENKKPENLFPRLG